MSSRSGRDDAGAGGARRPREPPEQELQRRREQKRRRHDAQQLQQLKHLESFYEKPPPGLIKEDETKPEDCIPDVPGNEHAREFLAHAPTKGLWMPLGKEVKVMQCWRCKRHGHRTGDKECPFFIKGNQKLEQFRVVSVSSVSGLGSMVHHFSLSSPLTSGPLVQLTQKNLKANSSSSAPLPRLLSP
nr:retinitis pigmentosa 9 protein-like isoform X2 [Equus asinus]